MMNRRAANRLYLLFTAALLGLLAGCAQPPTKPAKPAYTPTQLQQLNQAAALEASGDFTSAAQVYEQLAATASSPLRDKWLLQAADARLQGGDVTGAESALGGVQSRLLAPQDRLLARLVKAEILLRHSHTDLLMKRRRLRLEELHVPQQLTANRIRTGFSAQRQQHLIGIAQQSGT